MNVIAKNSCYFSAVSLHKKLRKEYLNIVIYETAVLLWIKKLNSLIYRTLFYVNTYGSYKLQKIVQFFWPTLYIFGSC